jgi:hypothetical protein
MNSKQLSFDCVNKYGPLTWREIEWGITNELIDWRVVKSIAIEKLSSESDQPNELAILNSDDSLELASILRNLSSSEPQELEGNIRSKWLRIVLADLFSRRNEVTDPLAEVERTYADFGYPEEIESFVRYMPASDGYDPQVHTHQENIDRLYSNWSSYVLGLNIGRP